ncbi:MAG: SMC-Scp complex subunit ScpB [Synergistaceae bacterium]|nr:SMC-Scp complex subunit ScpB [Synergistaceae bacterium]
MSESLNLKAKIEALLFMASSPVDEKELKDLLAVPPNENKNALKELKSEYESENRGIFINFIGGGWILETKPELYDLISSFRNIEKTKRVRLSKAAIETAAIIAYNQPVTRSEIDEIRGVHSDSSIAKLLEHGLIKISGRKGKTGGLLYVTTQKFLEIFGLDSLENLPAIDEIVTEDKTQQILLLKEESENIINGELI